MTPKEKSQDLVDFFRNYTDGTDLETNRFSPRAERLNAIKCSLKVVDEILSALYEYHYDSESGAYEFYSDVKKELEEMK